MTAAGWRDGDFDALREHYQAVIFDLPGLDRSAEAPALARFLDAVIVVAEAEATPLDTLRAAVAALRRARAPVIGVILNKAKPVRLGERGREARRKWAL